MQVFLILSCSVAEAKFWVHARESWGLPWSLSGKESACNAENAGDTGSIPGWEDPLEEGMASHSNILAWRISKDRGAWRATVHRGRKQLDTIEVT